MKPIFLASSSLYRADLLRRLRLPFTAVAPDTDEAPEFGERCDAMAARLADAKAHAVLKRISMPSGLVIGSDQVADLNGVPLGKPGNRENAALQLRSMRGQQVIFYTAIVLLDAQSKRTQRAIVPTTVRMRSYTDQAIAHYLDNEDALDCAGSAKSEGLGAALIASMTSDDPTALVGLPLLTLVTMLAAEGVDVLA